MEEGYVALIRNGLLLCTEAASRRSAFSAVCVTKTAAQSQQQQQQPPQGESRDQSAHAPHHSQRSDTMLSFSHSYIAHPLGHLPSFAQQQRRAASPLGAVFFWFDGAFWAA